MHTTSSDRGMYLSLIHIFNATLAGVIGQAMKEEQIDQVYGACYGIQGVLEQKFVNLTEKVDTEEKLEKLKSCLLYTSCPKNVDKRNRNHTCRCRKYGIL